MIGILPKNIDFLSSVIYNTLMKQTTAIIVNNIANSYELYEDWSRVFVCK